MKKYYILSIIKGIMISCIFPILVDDINFLPLNVFFLTSPIPIIIGLIILLLSIVFYYTLYIAIPILYLTPIKTKPKLQTYKWIMAFILIMNILATIYLITNSYSIIESGFIQTILILSLIIDLILIITKTLTPSTPEAQTKNNT